MKLVAGSLYDTAYRYNCTYCPFPVLLIGGFETHLSIGENNKKIIAGWEHVVTRLGNGTKTQPMGWLREKVSPNEVQYVLAAFDCKTFPLVRHKPVDARPKDPSLAATVIGTAYSSNRIADFFV